ncbi:hypothetical protein O3P69_013277 [Scylla paramamosain]|uniref:Uncharacterized protein n=1 Tax=Scylla paramamosain TaxID=85552 RepID=A0AAW0TZK8_SCYPA
MQSCVARPGQHIRVMESLHLTCDPYQEDSDLNVMLLSDRCCLRYASREIQVMDSGRRKHYPEHSYADPGMAS